MRKRVGSLERDHDASPIEWLDLEQIAQVEASSEDPAFPVEAALLPGRGPGWRPAQPGPQALRLVFDAPQRVRHIRVVFESDVVHTQEFALSWSADEGRSFREICRQQWNFSSPDALREIEDYRVELTGVTQLALTIRPDRSGGEVRSTLREWRVG